MQHTVDYPILEPVHPARQAHLWLGPGIASHPYKWGPTQSKDFPVLISFTRNNTVQSTEENRFPALIVQAVLSSICFHPTKPSAYSESSFLFELTPKLLSAQSFQDRIYSTSLLRELLSVQVLTRITECSILSRPVMWCQLTQRAPFYSDIYTRITKCSILSRPTMWCQLTQRAQFCPSSNSNY